MIIIDIIYNLFVYVEVITRLRSNRNSDTEISDSGNLIFIYPDNMSIHYVNCYTGHLL